MTDAPTPANQLQAVWKVKLSIDTTPRSASPTYQELRAGIENIEEALNEQTKQYFFMDNEGFAHNEVNGMAPAFTLSGRRVHGDPAQDYIEDMKYLTEDGRKTSIQLISTYKQGGAAKTTTITCPVTVTAITTIGGATNDNSPFNCTISLNGKPTVTAA